MLRSLAPTLLFALALSLNAVAENPAGIPAGYRLLYSQDFMSPDSLKDFTFTDPAVWKRNDAEMTNLGQNPQALELTAQSKYTPPFRSPVNIALLKDKQFGDVIIEADCLQTGKEYGHRDMIFVYGYQDPAHFYYTHIATAADDHAHNCFVVDAAPRVKFATEVTKGANWGQNVWHHVRIERKASDGTVRIFFDDLTKPIMTGNEKKFGAGAIGFGSFDDTCKITNVKVWGESVESKPTVPFKK